VRVGDDAALAFAIQEVLEAPDRWRSVASEAAVRVRASFGRDVVCASLEAAYMELAEQAEARDAA
jgi:hypothetical protein